MATSEPPRYRPVTKHDLRDARARRRSFELEALPDAGEADWYEPWLRVFHGRRDRETNQLDSDGSPRWPGRGRAGSGSISSRIDWAIAVSGQFPDLMIDDLPEGRSA